MKKKTIVTFVFLFALALGLNFYSRFKNFRASSGPLGDGSIDETQVLGSYHGEEVEVSEQALAVNDETQVLGEIAGEKWIEVDLSEQKIRAWQGDSLFLESLVSTGMPWWPTPTGEFRIWIKLRSTKMEGGSGAYYYNLPNVPFTMFFENSEIPGWRGFGLHGTYWHNDFGIRKSHGCVNLPTPIAEKLFYWVGPNLGERTWSVRSSESNIGTRIVIHE
ncbi:L,D-transpeptidase [Candidatus Microgenomates bacterium]|nr:L,D-transpeptidase [Candidatus Microgenomates bacterium]